MSLPVPAQSHSLAALPGIRHGFFGRQGGVSAGLYQSLNLGAGSDDAPGSVAKNRERVRQAMGADHLLSCHQIHSPTVVTLTEPFRDRPKADAMVTGEPRLGLCILTADCVPILFADAQAGVIGAAHAGWKGSLAGVVEATLQAMEALGSDRSHISAAIGPAIRQASYEVGPEFRDTWVGLHEWTDRLFVAGEGDKSHFDLTGYVRHVLQSEAVGAIDDLGHDTCAMERDYFSNRRRNHRGEPDYGRNGNVIVLAGPD